MNNCSFNSEKQAALTDFIPIQKIGEGSFSSVYKVRRINDNKLYALKKVIPAKTQVKLGNLKDKQKNNALNEIRILASLQSAYVIEYKQAFIDKKLNLLCIVMEWASRSFFSIDQGDLQKRIEKYKKKEIEMPQKQVWKAILHITEGLSLLHSKSILHRDVKTANIFISNGIYKLGDLNVSKVQYSQKLAYTQTGTPYYASPQVWRDEPYDCKSDIWSLGCIIYEMCAYKPPFRGKNLESLYKNVQKCIYEPIPINYSIDLSEFLASCLQKNPKNRPTALDILKAGGALAKKCNYYGIQKLNMLNSYQMLDTIKFSQDYEKLGQDLPKPRYSDIPYKSYKKNVTSSTQEKSQESKPQKNLEISERITHNIHKNVLKKQIKKYASVHQELCLDKLKQNQEISIQKQEDARKLYKIALLKRNELKSQNISFSQRHLSNKIGISCSKDQIKVKNNITDRYISGGNRLRNYQQDDRVNQSFKKQNKNSEIIKKISHSLDQQIYNAKSMLENNPKLSSERPYMRKYQSVLSNSDSQLINYLMKLRGQKIEKVKSTPYLNRYNLNVISEVASTPKMRKIIEDPIKHRQIRQFKKKMSKNYVFKSRI